MKKTRANFDFIKEGLQAEVETFGREVVTPSLSWWTGSEEGAQGPGSRGPG